MNFKSENFLIDTFLSSPKAFYLRVTGKKLSRYFVLREFDSGYGVADIVLGSFTPYLSVRNLRETVDSNWTGTLVDVLNGKPFTVDDFAARCGVSQKTARMKLNQFVAAGFLKTKRDFYSKNNDYKIAVNTSIAIEAKIKNWKQALNQARRYKRFANYSFVLLDEYFSSPAIENVNKFRKHNVGLISMNGFLPIIHFIPEYIDVPMNIYFYKLNEFVYDSFRENYGLSLKYDSK